MPSVYADSAAFFRTLSESSPLGVFLVDPAGQPTYANQRLLQWFGMDFERFSRGEWQQLIHPDDARQVEEITRTTREQTSDVDFEYRIVVDGRSRWIRVRSAPAVDSDGQLLGHVGSVSDTSAERLAAEERTQLQSQLQQARRLESLGLLAGGIAHDFNNLLVGILANASHVRDELPAEAPAREAIDDIAHAAQRAADLTRQLLAYAGRARVERREVALHRVLHDLPKLLGARVPARVGLTVDATQPVHVEGDETQIRQIVQNLVTNAVDALGASEGRIHIALRAASLETAELRHYVLGSDRLPGRYAIITVSDNGCGMTSEVQEPMFDPFFSTRGNGRGLGLGLAATLGILNSHAGAIRVESVLGRGTIITVLLPLSERLVTPASIPAIPDEIPGGSGVILLVDDDLNARSAARRILSRAGYTVHEAENGAHAIEVLEALEVTPRCVVLDVSMPIMSGDECLRTVRARGYTMPVLMSSGYDADDVASGLVQPGSVHFLQKPYTRSALLTALQELVGD